MKDAEVTYAVLLIVGAIWLIYLTIAVHRSTKRRSFLYLDIASTDKIVQIKYIEFPDSTREYMIRIPPGAIKLSLKSYKLFAVLSFESAQWTLHNARTAENIMLPKWIFIPAWKIKVFTKLINGNSYQVTPVAVHTHEYVYLKVPHGSPEPTRSVTM